MLYDKVVALVGPVPAGYEPLVYLCCLVILVWLLSTFFSILWSFLQLCGGGRRG